MTNQKFEKMPLVHEHRLSKVKQALEQSVAALDELSRQQPKVSEQLSDVDALLAEAADLIALQPQLDEQDATKLRELALQLEIKDEQPTRSRASIQFEYLETIQLNEDDTVDSLFGKYQDYAGKNSVDLGRNLSLLLSPEDIAAIDKRLDDDFVYKNAKCDKYDYMIAGTAGILGAIIDIFFVGTPGAGFLTQASDKATDKAVEKFASFLGWDGARKGKNPTKSAIAFWERKYRVNYDHRHGADVGQAFRMSTRNHHIKSLGHWPDLVGLFFSILDQFSNTAHFVHDGKIIKINTDNAELSGGNFIAKVFAGFVNWLGHLFSDVAGSSGAQGRGSGIPIPFFGLLPFVNIGEFGQYRQSFATVCVQVFEQGYDFRHGLAMSIPVIVTELLIRVMFFVKQHFYHKKSLKESIPKDSIPELRRMLLVGQGTLCIFDAGDAAMRSGGEAIQFLLRTNLIAWTRFGFLALKELNAFVNKGKINVELIDAQIDKEYKQMLLCTTL